MTWDGNVDWSDRFWSKVHPEALSGCWLWHAHIEPRTGYGRFNLRRRIVNAHRHAFRLVHGDVPAGMEVCHRCDVRACVNPNHMFLGTHLENMQDMWNKGRGHRSLTPDQVTAAMSMIDGGATVVAAAKAVGASDRVLYNIRRGVSYRHVTQVSR